MKGEAQMGNSAFVTVARPTSAKLIVMSLDQLLPQDTFFKEIYLYCILCLLDIACLNICADALPPSFLEEDVFIYNYINNLSYLQRVSIRLQYRVDNLIS